MWLNGIACDSQASCLPSTASRCVERQLDDAGGLAVAAHVDRRARVPIAAAIGVDEGHGQARLQGRRERARGDLADLRLAGKTTAPWRAIRLPSSARPMRVRPGLAFQTIQRSSPPTKSPLSSLTAQPTPGRVRVDRSRRARGRRAASRPRAGACRGHPGRTAGSRAALPDSSSAFQTRSPPCAADDHLEPVLARVSRPADDRVQAAPGAGPS